MSDIKQTREHLVRQLEEAHRRIGELEASEAEHGRLAEALRQSEERYRAVVESGVVGIGITDPEEKFVFVNQTFAEMLGYEGDELVGMHLSQLASPEEVDTYQAQTEQRREGVHSLYETTMRRRDGGVLNILVSASPLSARDGSFQGTMGVIVDITERKRAEESLQQAYELAQRQVEEQTDQLMREIAERERLQQEIIETQKRAILELSTPIIPITDRILVMPLIGGIDSLRAKEVMRALLVGIREFRAKVVILDVTGVPVVDSGVANHLNKTIQAARLKGAQTIITGISDEVAETIVDLGIDWSQVETLSDLQTGLRAALSKMGRRIEG